MSTRMIDGDKSQIERQRIALLETQVHILQIRIAAIETQFATRMHVLELALARASHGLEAVPETRPRRIVDDRGNVITLRESAA